MEHHASSRKRRSLHKKYGNVVEDHDSCFSTARRPSLLLRPYLPANTHFTMTRTHHVLRSLTPTLVSLWTAQHGVGVKPDPARARQYYRQSGSAPANLGLWLMGVSELAAELGAPIAFSVVVVAVATLFVQLRKRGLGAGCRPRRGQRPLEAAGRFGGGAAALRKEDGAHGAMTIERAGGKAVRGNGHGRGGE